MEEDTDNGDSGTRAAEEVFQKSAEAGVDNAMDALDNDGAFDIQTE
jgi:hypothetical protein